MATYTDEPPSYESTEAPAAPQNAPIPVEVADIKSKSLSSETPRPISSRPSTAFSSAPPPSALQASGTVTFNDDGEKPAASTAAPLARVLLPAGGVSKRNAPPPPAYIPASEWAAFLSAVHASTSPSAGQKTLAYLAGASTVAVTCCPLLGVMVGRVLWKRAVRARVSASAGCCNHTSSSAPTAAAPTEEVVWVSESPYGSELISGPSSPPSRCSTKKTKTKGCSKKTNKTDGQPIASLSTVLSQWNAHWAPLGVRAHVSLVGDESSTASCPSDPATSSYPCACGRTRNARSEWRRGMLQVSLTEEHANTSASGGAASVVDGVMRREVAEIQSKELERGVVAAVEVDGVDSERSSVSELAA